MTVKKSIVFVMLGLLSGLASCGSVKIPGFSTGSVGKTAQQAAPPPDDPIERAVQVAVTSARAQKCGYYFDPQKLRANFLTSEAQRTPDAEKIKKVETAYDFSNKKVTNAIANADGFCTPGRTNTIKASLTRYLAGDFSAPPKKKQVAQQGGIFGVLSQEQKPETFSQDDFFDPLDNDKGTKSGL